MSWSNGADDVRHLIQSGDIERIAGEAANGGFLLDAARQRLESARQLRESDPVSAFDLAYEGVRHVATALLTEQGLRPTSTGGHRAICEAVSAQFGPPFDFFNRMRQIRNALEYPRGPEALTIQMSVVDEALKYLDGLIDKATNLLPHLTMWR